MKRCMLVVAALVLVPIAFGDDDDTKKELERFKGTWVFESVEIGGEAAPADAFKDVKLILDGTKFTTQEGGQPLHGTFKIDVSKKPKTVDVTFTDGPEKGKTMQGIYELDGDTYKVCFDLEGKVRPTKFESKKGTMLILEVLKREKK